MATANPKPRSSSCLSFLKDALLLPSLNPKLFVPVLILVSFPVFITQATNVFVIQPFTVHIMELLNAIKGMDPSTPEYAELMAEIMKDTRELLSITSVFAIVAIVLGFAKQVLSFFAASSTYTGDRYSLPELISKVITRGHRIRGPLITIALVIVLEFAFSFLLAALLQLVFRRSGTFFIIAVAATAFLLLFVAFNYSTVVFMVGVAVSVADTERRGMAALGQAWRLMTRVWRKEGCVLAAVVGLLSTASSPLYMVALRCARTSAVMGLALLGVSAVVSGVVQLFSYDAAMVYYYQAAESKEQASSDDYVKIPTGEANV